MKKEREQLSSNIEKIDSSEGAARRKELEKQLSE